MSTEQDGWSTAYASAPVMPTPVCPPLGAGSRCWCGSPMSVHIGDDPVVVHEPGVAAPSVSTWGIR